MENESHSKDSIDLGRDEMLDKAKQLLTLTNLVEMYPAVVERRVTGLILILIGGAVSFATLVYTNIINLIDFEGDNLFLFFAFVIICLGLAFGIALKLIAPIYKPYARTDSSRNEISPFLKITWGILTSLIIALSVYAALTNQMFIFVIFLQVIMAIGNGANYYDISRHQDIPTSEKELLVFAIVIALSIVPMILFMDFAYIILILVDMGGLYLIGIYMLVTAEKLLLESSGR